MGSLQFFVYYNKNVFFSPYNDLWSENPIGLPLASDLTPCWLLGPRQFCSFSIRTSHTYWGHLASFSHQLRKPFLASLSLLPHECVTNNSLRVWCDKWPGIKEINVNINVFQEFISRGPCWDMIYVWRQACTENGFWSNVWNIQQPSAEWQCAVVGGLPPIQWVELWLKFKKGQQRAGMIGDDGDDDD